MTHAELVQRAERWLRHSAVIPCSVTGRPRRIRCGVVITEMMSTAVEIPDAIGWWCGGIISVLVECKVSRTDFLRDQKKHFRRRCSDGMGVYRYYLAPPGLIAAGEVPDAWGLLETTGRVVSVLKVAEHQERAIHRELSLLISQCARITPVAPDHP